MDTTQEAKERRTSAPAAKKRALAQAIKAAQAKAAAQARDAELQRAADRLKGLLGTQALSKKDATALLRMLSSSTPNP